MKVSELGERGLIDLLAGVVEAERGEIPAWRQLILGIGDDAAAWHVDNSIQLATTDSLVENVHFILGTTSWRELGWKALAVNLSDIAAMGGSPRYALVSLALPGKTEVADVAALYRGMLELARQFEVVIVGGNVSDAPLVVVTMTVLGEGSQDKALLTRSAAKPGEQIAVTGYLGASAAGLEILTKGLLLEDKAAESLKKAFLTPHPRVIEGQALVRRGVKTAIDISDGLLSDLRHVCRASKVGARIESERLPIHPAVRAKFGDRALELALNGGEDYELLFSASGELIDKVKATVSCPVTVIGNITADRAGEITLTNSRGQQVDVRKMGWEHFKPE